MNKLTFSKRRGADVLAFLARPARLGDRTVLGSTHLAVKDIALRRCVERGATESQDDCATGTIRIRRVHQRCTGRMRHEAQPVPPGTQQARRKGPATPRRPIREPDSMSLQSTQGQHEASAGERPQRSAIGIDDVHQRHTLHPRLDPSRRGPSQQRRTQRHHDKSKRAPDTPMRIATHDGVGDSPRSPQPQSTRHIEMRNSL